MSWSFYIILFILGSILGSFLNVIIWRVPVNESIVYPGSKCLHCGKPLKWWMNIPIVSFLFLRGKCYYCHKPISKQYIFVETVFGFIAVLLFYMYGWSLQYLFMITMSFFLFAIGVIDFKTTLIPDKLLLWWLITIFGFMFFSVHSIRWNWILGFTGAILGFVFYYFIAILGEKLFHKESLGMGDVKFATVVGFLLGVDLILPMSAFAGIVALVLLLPLYWRKIGSKKIYVPFGPFLCFSTFFFLLYGDLFRYYIVQ